MSDKTQKAFSFEISLSILNHLGRNLYRSFATVLGEAISNAWDADAENVHIYIDNKNGNFFIKDDGIGMSADDFQNKFLKIGYSKRKEGNISPNKRRPYIGRKGIGKLALLSCADKISVISKKDKKEYIGGVIDNSGLAKAITDDLTPKEYTLGSLNLTTFSQYIEGHDHGTIIYFENIKEGIKHSLGFLKKIVALYFRFSLIDNAFNIYINDEKVTHESLEGLALKTEFLWTLNIITDPFVDRLKKQTKEKRDIPLKTSTLGFIASVGKPSDLTILTMGERVSVDLFVNGRLRERDILKHITTAGVAESYLYGQIHYNDLDDAIDRFTSSREGVVADDPKYDALLEFLKKNVIRKVLKDWDTWRRKYRKDGDPENTNIPLKERKAEELFNVVAEDFNLSEASENKKKVDDWVNGLGRDARFNFTSYAECFISENLIRKYIHEKEVKLSPEANSEIAYWQSKETDNKNKGNISIEIRESNTNLSYLSMDGLANLVDKKDFNKEACLARDAKVYKPFRDAIAHTALLTEEAKRTLSSVYDNVKSRIKTLLS